MGFLIIRINDNVITHKVSFLLNLMNKSSKYNETSLKMPLQASEMFR